MTDEDRLLGELEAGHSDHERRIVSLESDVRGLRRFQTSFMAILAAGVASVAIWSKGLKDWLSGP